MAELLETDFAVAEKDRLYRCLDRILEHKQALFVHLRQRWQDLFAAPFDVLLYDLTSTYKSKAKANRSPKPGTATAEISGLIASRWSSPW